MKKLMFTALLAGTAVSFGGLPFAGSAHAEGKSALQSETQTNTDVSAGSATPDNSYARGSVEKNDASGGVTATSTTGSAAGTASITVDDGEITNAQTGTRNGDDDASTESERTAVSDDMDSKTGVMKTRAKGAMGMLNPDEIRQVQSNLKQAGYRVSTDGVWGPDTRAALKEYQKTKKLNVTGEYDADTRASFDTSGNN